MFGKRFWLGVTLPLLFGFDWWTKEAARSLPLGAEVPVVPGALAWTHAENPWIAFSVPIPYVVIVSFGVIAVGGLAVWAWQLPTRARLQAVAVGAVAAGALGNLVDRLADGTVTDFVRVYTTHPTLAPWLRERFGTSTWPIFNVADVALFCGVGLSVAGSFFERDGAPPADEEPEEPLRGDADGASA